MEITNSEMETVHLRPCRFQSILVLEIYGRTHQILSASPLQLDQVLFIWTISNTQIWTMFC